MKRSRQCLLKVSLQKDHAACVEIAAFFNNQMPRNESPNVQDMPCLKLDPQKEHDENNQLTLDRLSTSETKFK